MHLKSAPFSVSFYALILQASRYLDAIQHGKAVIGEYNYNELLSIDIEDVKIVKAIEDLYQKLAETQEKAFGPIVKQALKKD